MKRTVLQKLNGRKNMLLSLVKMGIKKYIIDLIDIESEIEELTAKNVKLAVSKKRAIAFLKNKLSTNSAWALRALVVVYSGQTQAERIAEETSEHNGIGFTAFDAGILSSLSLQYTETGKLSNKQLELLFDKMPKYAGQLLALSDIEKLNRMLVE
ncbi:hypothetical protein [Cylindrospermopsis raciborskii]|uniref:hypothetical protein n=1 Tax=Cylindrospermopsis raciborskii TaxID=77022 RepID=UPI0022BAD67E|nr:hypothetical protein [Cylindrospermopsis raciborskii]MCZ2207835.1 hypothetical protein [Cylindrospermopsis raciborskii PAMP2011]